MNSDPDKRLPPCHAASRAGWPACCRFGRLYHLGESLTVSGNGMSFEDVLQTIASDGLGLSEAERKDRVKRARSFVLCPPEDPDFNRHWLGAVITLNLFEHRMRPRFTLHLCEDNLRRDPIDVKGE